MKMVENFSYIVLHHQFLSGIINTAINVFAYNKQNDNLNIIQALATCIFTSCINLKICKKSFYKTIFLISRSKIDLNINTVFLITET